MVSREEQATNILEPLEQYVYPEPFQLAVDLYLKYDNQEGVTKIVENLGERPESATIYHTRSVAIRIDDFGHFAAAYYTKAPRWAADEKVLKTKTKYVWKYDPLGTNRYAKRVTIENGKVVAYDTKG